MKDSVTNDEELVAAEEPEAASQGPAESRTAEADPVEADAPAAGLAAEGEVSEEIARLSSEFQDLSDKHLRLAAEFNNYRRRSEQERLGAWGRAQADVIGKFLEVLDDLSRVAHLDLSSATVEAIMEGVDLVERKFVRILEDTGVEVIDPPPGEPFDPERMEAMMRVVAESEEQDDSVAQVMQKGYALGGVLVRPARVAVYKHG